MQTSTLGVVADFDKRVGQFAQFLDGFYIGSTHIGRSNNAQLTAVLCEGSKFIHNEAQAAPLDEGNQHINAIAGHDLLL